MTSVLKFFQQTLPDQLGSSNVILEDTGTVYSREEYYPFGELRSNRERLKKSKHFVSQTSFGSFIKKRYRYVGKEKDEESGMYYYGARYYSPWTGRFISVDPLAAKYCYQAAYVYAEDNPINKMDFNGEGTGGGPSGDNGSKSTTNNSTCTKNVNATIHFVKDSSVTDAQFDNYISSYTTNIESVFNNTPQSYTDNTGQTWNVGVNASYTVDNITPQQIPTNTIEGHYYVIIRGTSDALGNSGVSKVDSKTNVASMNINETSDNTISHEFLHQLGLADRYNYYQRATNGGRTVSNQWRFVPMALDFNYDREFFQNEMTNIMTNTGATGITSKQWEIIFNSQRENLPQYTFYGNFANNDVSGRNSTVSLGVSNNGRIFSNQNVTAGRLGVLRHYNPKNNTGNKQYGNEIRSEKASPGNFTNALLPYIR